MPGISYFPILKWKRGEQVALRELDYHGDSLFPIIEIIGDASPAAFFDEALTCINSPFYYDTIRCGEDGDDERTSLRDFAQNATSRSISALPVIYVSDLYRQNGVTDITTKFALRIPIPIDFEGPSFQEILDRVSAFPAGKKIDILLDAGEVITRDKANLIYPELLRSILALDFDSHVIDKIAICVSSFPNSLDLDAGENVTFERYDFRIFQALLREISNRPLTLRRIAYSDYGVTKFTETELDFSRMRSRPLLKVKYTTRDSYIVFKGRRNNGLGVPERSAIDIAKEIYHSPYYFGGDFSFGDRVIQDKATSPNPTPGNATTWVSVSANHHLAVVIEQLSNLNET